MFLTSPPAPLTFTTSLLHLSINYYTTTTTFPPSSISPLSLPHASPPSPSTSPFSTLLTHHLSPPGTIQLPGGHLEHGESFSTCAVREALEETGLEIGHVKFLTATNDVMDEEEDGGVHYVTVFVTGVVVGEEKIPIVSC
jgi:hypothetical protein